VFLFKTEFETMKKSLEELALFGGAPTFSETLHIGRPNIGSSANLLKRINDILDRRWLTNSGVYVREFEQRVAELVGVRHCIAMCNGTVALEIVARALGMEGEVIVPSFTFIATAHCLQWQGVTPVFCDIDPKTLTINPSQIERLITPKTTGIIGVHLWGTPCDIDALEAISKKHNLKLLFDASHAFSCTYKHKKIGGFGAAEVFSFHATKFFNTLEGGAVVTNDDILASKLRLMKNFGFSGMDNVIYIGTNGKMNEFSAAMGLTSLESLEEFISANLKNYRTYQKYLSKIPGINLRTYDERESNNYQYIIIDVDSTNTGISRDHLINVLHAENIRARRYFYPGCHRMEPYRSYYPNTGLLLPETEKMAERVICLPTGTAVRPEDIEKICRLIRLVVKHSTEIGSKLSKPAFYHKAVA
jgi:dTDP-4-amino-4,6-dideoxygalactose transaminase